MKLRQANPCDANRLAEIHVQSWIDTYTGLMPSELLDGLSVERRRQGWVSSLESRVYLTDVVERQGNVVGFNCYGPTRDTDYQSNETGEILAIYLEKSSQGLGLGKVLFESSRGYFQSCKFTCFTLWVLESNTAARSFYEAMGMRPEGTCRIDESYGHGLKEVRYIANLG